MYTSNKPLKFIFDDDGDISHEGSSLPMNQIFLVDLSETITDSECDYIVDAIKKYKLKNIEKGTGNSNCRCHGIDLQHLANIPGSEEIATNICKTLQKGFDKLKVKVNNNIEVNTTTAIQLREIWGYTSPHTDVPAYEGDDRVLSVIIALNDDYEGGIFNFPEQQFSCKLKKLQMIAFPPFWTHPHYVSKPLYGTVRYTVNTWLSSSHGRPPPKPSRTIL